LPDFLLTVDVMNPPVLRVTQHASTVASPKVHRRMGMGDIAAIHHLGPLCRRRAWPCSRPAPSPRIMQERCVDVAWARGRTRGGGRRRDGEGGRGEEGGVPAQKARPVIAPVIR